MAFQAERLGLAPPAQAMVGLLGVLLADLAKKGMWVKHGNNAINNGECWLMLVNVDYWLIIPIFTIVYPTIIPINDRYSPINVGKTMPCLPPMTGNGKFIPPINMVMAGGWFIKLCYPH